MCVTPNADILEFIDELDESDESDEAISVIVLYNYVFSWHKNRVKFFTVKLTGTYT